MRVYRPTGRPRGRPPKYPWATMAPETAFLVLKSQVAIGTLKQLIHRQNCRSQAEVGGPQGIRLRNYALDDTYHPTHYTVWRTR